MKNNEKPPTGDPMVPEHVGQSMQSIAALFARAEARVGRHQLAIERITDNLGRPFVIYLLSVVVALWVTFNTLAPHLGLQSLDPPPFKGLESLSCVAALLLGLMILTTQNRLAALTTQRALLDLQVNLIAEEKVAKLVALVEELRSDLPSVVNRRDSLAEAMKEAVNLDAVTEKLEAMHSAGASG